MRAGGSAGGSAVQKRKKAASHGTPPSKWGLVTAAASGHGGTSALSRLDTMQELVDEAARYEAHTRMLALELSECTE